MAVWPTSFQGDNGHGDGGFGGGGGIEIGSSGGGYLEATQVTNGVGGGSSIQEMNNKNCRIN